MTNYDDLLDQLESELDEHDADALAAIRELQNELERVKAERENKELRER